MLYFISHFRLKRIPACGGQAPLADIPHLKYYYIPVASHGIFWHHNKKFLWQGIFLAAFPKSC